PWLRDEEDSERLAIILASVREHPANLIHDVLETVVCDRKKPVASRVLALHMLADGLDVASEQRVSEVARKLEDGLGVGAAIRELAKHPRLTPSTLALSKLSSSDPYLRAAAVDSLALLHVADAAQPVYKLLDDKDIWVRRSAVAAMGTLGVRAAVPTLMKLA